jgi:hypothetical protein
MVSARTAESTPMGMAMRMAKQMARPPRRRVMGSRMLSSSVTVRFVHSDSPRFPVRTLPTHAKYWM